MMAVYQVESAGGNLPARISLLRMPDRVELRQKNLFSVADVQMFWHPQGDYLAVQVCWGYRDGVVDRVWGGSGQT